MTTDTIMTQVFTSKSVSASRGRQGGIANFAEVIDDVSEKLKRIGDAITPCVAGGKDATGGHVESLTEAVMGVTGGLMAIAESIDRLAGAVSEHGK